MYWEYATQLGLRFDQDPVVNPSVSPYSTFKRNPIWYTDPNGDSVGLDGFKQNKIRRELGSGIRVSSKNNPYSFNGTGKLTIDKKKYDKLSATQKKIVDNVRAVAESSTLDVTIKKVDDSYEIPGYDIMLGKAGGAATAANRDKDGYVDYSGGHGVTIYWNGNGSFQSKLRVPDDVTLYHELGGHTFYRFIMKDPQQGSKTIGYENTIRWFLNLPKRPMDEAHSH